MDQVIQLFNQRGIRYLVIGGQAVRLHGFLRGTMDWDFFIPPKDAVNFAAINDALRDEFDEELEPLGPRGEGFIQTFQTRWGILQFHLLVPGLTSFDDAEKSAVTIRDDNGTEVRCLSTEHLLAAKRATSRPQDQADIEFLQRKTRPR